MKPTIGRIVWYRSRTGDYTVPAIITATNETLWLEGVARGDVPDLSSDTHVHLEVLTPGAQGRYQEHDVPLADTAAGPAPETSPPRGTAGELMQPRSWMWPVIVRPSEVTG